MPETPNQWVQLIGLIVASGLFTAVVQAISTRKKTGAETTEKVVQGAGQLNDDLREDYDRARRERLEEHERANRGDVKLRGWWARADALAPWIRRQEMRNLERGIDDPAPPLFPPPGE